MRQNVPAPKVRCLRVFAVDPGAAATFGNGVPNEVTLRIPWEDEIDPGPCGEYVEVVDDGATCAPLDLDAPDVLADGGLAPSDGDRRFRQQMAFAVAMKTIDSFERALGRPAQWVPEGTGPRERYRQRLAIRPHRRRVLNAWYDPAEGVCLGYDCHPPEGEPNATTIFTCLSQDAIASTVTQALLRGMNVDFGGVHDDSAAMFAGFADLVALFQHFTESEILTRELAAVRGDLRQRSSLSSVAPQLGTARGHPEGVRNALGRTVDGAWEDRVPHPDLYRSTSGALERGTLLLSAVYLAFTQIYEARIADLRRLATRGTGILPDGALHPDLVARFAHEASEAAQHVLQMCIRALDYLPPIGVRFGDFLRAIVTADHDLVPDDPLRYRVAFVDAFRKYGIAPAEGGTVSVETLVWPRADPDVDRSPVAEYVRGLSHEVSYWGLPRDREEHWNLERRWRSDLAKTLEDSATSLPRLGPVDLSQPFNIVSLDLRERSGPAGDLQLLWVVKVVQRSRGGSKERAGCTLLIDAASGNVRYRIGTREPERRPTELLQRADTGAPPLPRRRALRVFAFDPTLGAELSTVGINEVTLKVPWGTVTPGPAGEYVEVIDHDPSSGCFYEPIDLSNRNLLAQDGLAPSESNPQFHQQMVYAVTMRVIRDFEDALGRRALWSPRRGKSSSGEPDEYVGQLRIYPHALREANAYYSPDKKALLFGYFSAARDGAADRQTVFTCLSQDIIAHEVTHALLDGMHTRFREPSNPDVLAFHEAFADIVALFEHFSLPGVLHHHIAETRGDLASQNRLGELAQQFGEATGRRAALRSAIGRRNEETGEWEPITPEPEAYRREFQPHRRGSILVAAVFDAFLTIYKARVADLLRIATEGTGVLPAGQLHPDLVGRLADEAATAARRVLHMCIRSLDYCPPVDITFGDYLRALVTADYELNPLDPRHDRVAFAEGFRRYGIVPEGVRTLSVDGLIWRPPTGAPDEGQNVVVKLVRTWTNDIASFGPTRDRKRLFTLMAKRRAALHEYLEQRMSRPAYGALAGIDVKETFEVHSIRPSLSRDWRGRPRFNWIIELTQRRAEFFDEKDPGNDPRNPDYWFRGGSTLVIDAATGALNYAIRKPLDKTRRKRQRDYQWGEARQGLAPMYFGGRESAEPFALLHRDPGGAT